MRSAYHHSDILNGSDRSDESADTVLRHTVNTDIHSSSRAAAHLIVELVESELVDRYTGCQSLLLQSLCSLCASERLSSQSSGIIIVLSIA